MSCQVTLSLQRSVTQAGLEPDLELVTSSSFLSVGITEVHHVAQLHLWSWQRQRLEFGPPCPLLAVTLDKPHPSCELASVTICGVGEAGVQRCLEGGTGLVLKE